MRFVVRALLGGLLLSRAAWADGPSLTVSAEAQLGLGAPTGFLGAALAFRVGERLSLTAGLGEGRTGTQTALAARWHFDATDVGVGYSYGPFHTPVFGSITDEDETVHHWNRAHFANVEAGRTARWSRVYLRLFGGAAYTTNEADYHCAEKLCGNTGANDGGGDRAWIVYVGVGFGVDVLRL